MLNGFRAKCDKKKILAITYQCAAVSLHPHGRDGLPASMTASQSILPSDANWVRSHVPSFHLGSENLSLAKMRAAFCPPTPAPGALPAASFPESVPPFSSGEGLRLEVTESVSPASGRAATSGTMLSPLAFAAVLASTAAQTIENLVDLLQGREMTFLVEMESLEIGRARDASRAIAEAQVEFAMGGERGERLEVMGGYSERGGSVEFMQVE